MAGVGFELRSDDPPALAGLLQRWRHLPRLVERPPLVYDLLIRPRPARLICNGRSLRTSRAPEAIGACFETALYRRLVEESPALPLHAAAVSWGSGAVLLLGASGAGKSRTAWTLCARGASYLGEEHAFVDEGLGLEGFPRALSFEAEGQIRLAWPAQPLHRAPRVGLVIVLSAAEGACAASSEQPLASAEAGALLAAALHRVPSASDMRVVARLAAAVPVLRASRRPLDLLAERIEALAADCGLRSSSRGRP